MIATLTGRVAEVAGGCCLLDVNGVGYELRVPLPALEELAGSGGEVRLHTYLHLREDGVQLFGFLTLEEKRVFERLIGVTGIGPKIALSILSVLTVERLSAGRRGGRPSTAGIRPGHRAKNRATAGPGASRQVERRYGSGPARTNGQRRGRDRGRGRGLVALGYPMPAALQAVEAAAGREDGNQTAPALVRGALKRLAR